MKIFKTNQLAQQGFTLVELMIATVVFSVVLLLVTFGVLQVSRNYYKGVTSTKTQQTARAIIDQISQAIQFSGGTITPTAAPSPGSNQVFCLNSQRYSYVLGRKLTDGTNHVLVVDTPPCTGSSTAQNLATTSLTAGSKELVAPNMRLAKLSVSSVGTNLWQVTVRVVYGDDDLLISPSGASPAYSAPDAGCDINAGSQFCAVSELSTVVQKRLN